MLAEEAVGLHVTQTRKCEEEDPERDEDAARQTETDETLQVLERCDRLLAGVGLHQIERLGEGFLRIRCAFRKQ